MELQFLNYTQELTKKKNFKSNINLNMFHTSIL